MSKVRVFSFLNPNLSFLNPNLFFGVYYCSLIYFDTVKKQSQFLIQGQHGLLTYLKAEHTFTARAGDSTSHQLSD